MTKKADNKKAEDNSTIENGNVALLKKLSPKTICGAVKDLPEGFLYRVTGVAKDVKTGQSDYGEWTALMGNFIAQKVDGAKCMGAKCFLPEPGSSMIAMALISGDVEEVQFSFDIYKQANDSSATGYEYITKPVIKVQQSNLIESLVQSLPALPSPEK